MNETKPVIAPIADLSYRNYDGPLVSPRSRWWVVAKQGMRIALQKKSLYLMTILTGWYYVVMIIVLFFIDQISQMSPERQQFRNMFLDRIVWKDQFLHGFSYAQFFILIIALILGAGAIANDNRANALLVYLSKPCTKFDYIFGKWIGIFVPMLVLTAIPTVIFYAYCALSYRSVGFITEDPWILPKMLGVLPIAAMIHSSVVLGVSSLFNQGRVAGATYMGLYLLPYFFTTAINVSYQVHRGHVSPIFKSLFYCSIDGLQIGLAKAALGTSGTGPFGAPQRGMTPIPPPSLPIVLGISLLITALSLILAWRRIRAVEVVG